MERDGVVAAYDELTERLHDGARVALGEDETRGADVERETEQSQEEEGGGVRAELDRLDQVKRDHQHHHREQNVGDNQQVEDKDGQRSDQREQDARAKNWTHIVPSSEEISRMEVAIAWPAHYLGGLPHVLRTVQIAALARSRGHDMSWGVLKLDLSGSLVRRWNREGLDAIAAGLRREDAVVSARMMGEADLTGADAHGVFRLPQYVRRLKASGFNPRPTITVTRSAPATALVDGDNAMGHLVMTRAAHLAVELAHESGVGWVGALRSNHAGAASVYSTIPLSITVAFYLNF